MKVIFQVIKKYFLIFIVALLVMIYLLFPFGDIGDMVSIEIAKATQNRVQIQFEDMNLHLIPLGVDLYNVKVKTQVLPELQFEELSLRPSLSGLLSKKPLGRASITHLWGGNIDATISKAKPSEKTEERYHLELDVEKIHLSDLKKILQLPMDIDGNASLQSGFDFDLQLAESPEGQFSANFENVQASSISVPTPLGPLSLPSMSSKKIQAQGKYAQSQLLIENLELGEKQDEIQGTLKGSLNLSLRSMNSRMLTQFGSYSIESRLNVKSTFISKMAILIDFLNSQMPEGAYKTNSSGVEYRVKASGDRFGAPPRFDALR